MAGTKGYGSLDPLTLAKDVTTLVSAGLVAQARALAVARQQDAAAYVSDSALAIRTRNSQEEFRTDVAYYLNRLLPDVIATLSSTAGAAALVGALEKTVGTVNDEKMMTELLGATLTQFQDYQGTAAELANSLDEGAKRSTDRKGGLEALLQRQIDALDGPDGEIQKTRDAITETTTAIGDDLSAVVKAANAIGGGVTTFLTDKFKLVTGILTTFGGGKDKKDGGDGEEEKPAEKPFTMESIDMEETGTTGSGDASSGSSDLGSAVAAFHEHNAKLAKLFQKLATQNASVAVAAAISDQVDAFARSVSDVAAAAAAVAATWQRVADAMTTLGDEDPAGLPRDVAKAAPRWTAAAAELTNARAAIAGKRGAIPDVGPLRRNTAEASAE